MNARRRGPVPGPLGTGPDAIALTGQPYEGLHLSESIARLLIGIAGVYLAAGALFALPFVLWLAGRLEPAARAGSRGFRAIIVPGVILLWPVLLARLLTRR